MSAPIYGNIRLAVFAEGTTEEQMFKRLFHVGIAEGASIVIANVVVSSLQHVSGVESVR